MTERARIRVNLAQREVEIEGAEDFVREWAERLDELLGSVPSEPAAPLATAEQRPSPPGAAARPPFGQFIQAMRLEATDVDRMLAAGYWVQQGNGDDCYTTGETSRLLSEQGFRIGNPSQCVKQSLNAKRCFQLQRGRYRVSATGRAHLRQLMGEVIELQAS